MRERGTALTVNVEVAIGVDGDDDLANVRVDESIAEAQLQIVEKVVLQRVGGGIGMSSRNGGDWGFEVLKS